MQWLFCQHTPLFLAKISFKGSTGLELRDTTVRKGRQLDVQEMLKHLSKLM